MPYAYSWLLVCCLLTVFLIWFTERLNKAGAVTCQYRVHPRRFAFKAGDVLLCSTSLFNRLFVQSTWGHVALVYRDPWNDMLCVWEIQIPVEGSWRAHTTSLKSQATRLTPLYRYLDRCPKPVCVRSISKEVNVMAFHDFIKTKWEQPFGFEFFANAGSRIFMDIVGIPVLPRKKKSGRYCAEMVAETLSHLGVLDFQSSLDSHVKPSRILPRDFAKNTERLPLTAGYEYGDEILLDSRGPSSGTLCSGEDERQ